MRETGARREEAKSKQSKSGLSYLSWRCYIQWERFLELCVDYSSACYTAAPNTLRVVAEKLLSPLAVTMCLTHIQSTAVELPVSRRIESAMQGVVDSSHRCILIAAVSPFTDSSSKVIEISLRQNVIHFVSTQPTPSPCLLPAKSQRGGPLGTAQGWAPPFCLAEVRGAEQGAGAGSAECRSATAMFGEY